MLSQRCQLLASGQVPAVNLAADSPEQQGPPVRRERRAPGFASLGLSAADFQCENRVVQLGHPPNRIDLLTSISGVPVPILSKDCLVRNKRASGRDQDLEDLKRLL